MTRCSHFAHLAAPDRADVAAMQRGRRVRRFAKGFAWLLALGASGVAALVGGLWLEHSREITLPEPTGPFAVGRATYDWVDESALDALAPTPGTRREVLAWIWYPAVAGPAARPVDYVPPVPPAVGEPPRVTPIGRVLSALFTLLTRDPSRVRAHSLRDAEVAPGERSYPVLILRGGASAPVLNYSTLAEDLASHGYVVVGFDAPYRTGLVAFPDGRVITRTPANNPELCEGKVKGCLDRLLAAWTSDIAFVIDRLARLNGSESGQLGGRLDLTRIGVFGHSFGGSQAAQFCHDDPRCKAGIDIDGAPLGSAVGEGIRRPFLILLSDHSKESGPETRRITADIQSLYDRLPRDTRMRAAIRGANHFTFSDDGALLKSALVRGVLRALGRLGMDGRRQLAVTAYCLRTFFDAYLKGNGEERPTIASPAWPEVETTPQEIVDRP
jgi:predicted dienelactone hydrolase